MSLEKLRKLSLPPEVFKALEELVKALRERCDDVEVYLFGSYARGTWLEDSDIDLIVISKCFEGMGSEERYRYVRNLASKRLSFELLIYTPQEFEKVKKRSIVIQDAMEYWIKLT